MNEQDEAPPRREMPASEEAEQHVLACCMIEGSDTASRCAQEGVTAGMFYWPANSLTFQAIQALHSAGTPPTLETVAEELTTRRLFEQVGGFPYLVQITQKIPTSAHAAYFIEKLREKSRLRELIKAATGAIEEAYAFTGGIEEFVSRQSDRFNRALQAQEEAEEKFQVVAERLAVEAEEFGKTGVAPARDVVPWGLLDLDRIAGSMSPGELVVLGGRPSTGKSALADQVAWRTADKLGYVLLFTYEMSKREKAIRIAQQNAGRLHSQMGAGEDAREFAAAFRRIKNCPNLHVFERDVSVGRVVGRCRSFAASKKIRLIVVDFLQYLARLEPTIGKERTDEKIGRLTAALKDLARECDCPVLMLASLNRDGEKEGRPPRMSDLRASGEIESDADVIALLHWPKSTPNGEQDPHEQGRDHFYVDFSQEKGRNKGVHHVGLTFNRRATRFQNYCP